MLERGEQLPQLLLDLLRPGHRVRDLLAQQLAVAPRSRCAATFTAPSLIPAARPSSRYGISARPPLSVSLRPRNKSSRARVAVFPPQPAQHHVQQRQRPLTVKGPVGSVTRRDRLRAARLGGVELQRDDLRRPRRASARAPCPIRWPGNASAPPAGTSGTGLAPGRPAPRCSAPAAARRTPASGPAPPPANGPRRRT